MPKPKPKLNANAQKWVKALRSGKYRKGTHKLRSTVNRKHYYCAIGVAVHVALKSGVKIPAEEYFYWGQGSCPRAVQEWLGYTGISGKYLLLNGQSVVALNDATARNNFKAIAKEIEAHADRFPVVE